jgi:TetR/AcrR family transcriptional regulator, cholesterol catabolism regulator
LCQGALTPLAGPRMVAQRMRKAPAPRAQGHGRREQNKLDKRERIRRAAWEMFTEIGYDDTTTRAVADRADVATGTLFLYAADKRDLLCLVMHDELAAVTDDRFATMRPDVSLVQQLMHLFSGLFAMYRAYPELAAAFVRHFPGADGPNGRALMKLTVNAVSRIAELIVTMQERGEVAADIDAFQAATNFFSLYFGVLISWISGLMTNDFALDATLRGALELQIRGLRP